MNQCHNLLGMYYTLSHVICCRAAWYFFHVLSEEWLSILTWVAVWYFLQRRARGHKEQVWCCPSRGRGGLVKPPDCLWLLSVCPPAPVRLWIVVLVTAPSHDSRSSALSVAGRSTLLPIYAAVWPLGSKQRGCAGDCLLGSTQRTCTFSSPPSWRFICPFFHYFLLETLAQAAFWSTLSQLICQSLILEIHPAGFMMAFLGVNDLWSKTKPNQQIDGLCSEPALHYGASSWASAPWYFVFSHNNRKGTESLLDNASVGRLGIFLKGSVGTVHCWMQSSLKNKAKSKQNKQKPLSHLT